MGDGAGDERRDENVMSRRAVLKAAGVATVGSLVATVAPASVRAASEAKPDHAEQAFVPPQLIEGAIKAARQSPLFKREIEQLQQAGLEFDVSASAVKQSALLDNVVGLLFETVKTSSPRFGANLLITADTKSNTLVSLQYIISWSLLHALEIESVVFDANDPLEIDLGGPNRAGTIVPRIVRPHIEQHWSFPRAEPLAPRPEELVESGWPPESPDFPRWHFSGGVATGWLLVKSTPVYAVKSVTEVFSDESRQAPVVDLSYDGNLSPLPAPKPEVKQP